MKSTVGLGLRHSFHGYVLENKPTVPFFEIITENYLYFDGSPKSFLHKIRENYPLVFHGVSLSIGSLEPIRTDYLKQLKKMIGEFQPLWISDHLCWTFNGQENSHDLLPVPFTNESLKRIISKTQQVQDFLGQKIYLENPSAYVDFKNNDYSEEDFISELCKKSGCGLLLDLNNLVVNQYNLGYNPINYLNTIKQCDIKQIHLAGHTVKEQVRIDTHDSDISLEVLDLLPVAKHFWPEASPMIEWDDKIPPIDYLLSLREKIENQWKAADLTDVIKSTPSKSEKAEMPLTDEKIHDSFWNLLKTKDYVTDLKVQQVNILKNDVPTPAHIGMNVYSSAYYNRMIEVLEKIFPALKIALNELFSDVMLEYLDSHPSTNHSIDFIGNNLAKFIQEHNFSYSLGADQLIISDIANFENSKNASLVAFADKHQTLITKSFTEADWLNTKLKVKSEIVIQAFNSEIHLAIDSIQKGEVPEIPDIRKAYYLFYRHGDEFTFKLLSYDEFAFLNSFKTFKTFSDAITEPTQVQAFADLLFKYEAFFCFENKALQPIP